MTIIFKKRSNKKLIIIFVIVLVGLGILALGLGLAFGLPPASSEETRIYRGGVVTNGYECADIGSSILRRGGNAIDATIAAMFCEGIAMPQSMGLGGGFIMTIYNRTTRSSIVLNARERAPIAATEDMFGGNSTLSSIGPLAIAVPGELKGYYEAHSRYGVLPWADVVQPTIDLCTTGHLVTPYLANLLRSTEYFILEEPTLREIYVDPETNHVWTEGHLIKRPQLAETLKVIAREGSDALYQGSLTSGFIEDIQAFGGIITEEDLLNYEVDWQEPIEAHIDDMTMYTVSPPGSGVILAFITNILNTFIDKSSPLSVTNWQRIVESFKYGYGRRTELGDPDFINITELLGNLTSVEYAEYIRNQITDGTTFTDPVHYGANFNPVVDHGTASIAVLAPNGDAVSVTSTINLYFGSRLRSRSTGIILNDEMDDFSAPNITNSFGIPPSPANYIHPGKRPISSMCPSIIVNSDGNVRLVIGAAGGTRITSSVALASLTHLWFNYTLPVAISNPRIHHQLFPMEMTYEEGFDQAVLNGLQAIGHETRIQNSSDGFAAVVGISNRQAIITGAVDPRRQGRISLIE